MKAIDFIHVIRHEGSVSCLLTNNTIEMIIHLLQTSLFHIFVKWPEKMKLLLYKFI